MPALLIGGLIALALGIIFFFIWFTAFIAIIKATLPMMFIVAGAVATYLGWEELRDNKGPAMDFSSPDEAKRYTTEAQSYQRELNGLQNNKVAAKEDQDQAPPTETSLTTEAKTNEAKTGETGADEAKTDETKTDETGADDTKTDETKTGETGADDNQEKPRE